MAAAARPAATPQIVISDRLTNRECHDVLTLSAEGHTDTYLNPLPLDGVRRDAMQADSCQQESQDPEEARQPRDQAFLLSCRTNLIGERMKAEREIAIDRRDRARDAADQQGG